MKTQLTLPIALLATALHTSAATIISPTVTKVGGGNTQSGSLSQLVDNSGLSSDLNTGDLVPDTLPTHTGGLTYPNNAARWFTIDILGALVPDELIFDLGQVYSNVADVLFWNYEESGAGDRGISSVTATFSNDGVTYTGSTTLNFAQVTEGANPFAGETVALNQTDIQYVKFSNLSGPAVGSLIGLSEIRFTTNPIPEPSSTALLSLGALAFTMRRCRS